MQLSSGWPRRLAAPCRPQCSVLSLRLPCLLCSCSLIHHACSPSPHPARAAAPPPPARSTMLSVSRTYLEMPVVIHEFSAAAVPPEELEELKQINPRSRLYVMRVPPDQLNPEG